MTRRIPTSAARSPSFWTTARIWQGIKDFALGVDTASLASRPSVFAAVEGYANAALRVSGAVQAQAKNKLAAIFGPETVVAAEAELTELVTQLGRCGQRPRRRRWLNPDCKPYVRTV
ncbi:hypothetical protein AB0368_16030 [Actinoplanes sp. NPDC051475]|uniref:hypothetical protein n=1 Tax=Actinoplanes sp. NPDC051475 TaxID=3157225 RepID=UPI00344D1C98